MRRKTEDGNSIRKIITLKNFSLVDGYVKDMAFVKESNDSAVIENILMEKILSDSLASAHYIRSIYDVGLKQTYITLMQLLSAGIDFKAAYDNAFELVKLGMKILNQPFTSGIDPEYEQHQYYLKSCCSSVLRKLEYEIAKRQLSFDEEQTFLDDKMFLTQEIKNPIDFIPYKYFKLVIARWDILENYTFTFRMLFAVVALSEPSIWDNPEYRLMARNVIAEVCKNWEMY